MIGHGALLTVAVKGMYEVMLKQNELETCVLWSDAACIVVEGRFRPAVCEQTNLNFEFKLQNRSL